MRGHFMLVFVFLTIAFGGTLALAASHANRDTVEFIVRSKERVAMGNNSAKYLVFTNVETFEITDSLAENRFDSSDMYGVLRNGHCYRGEVYGWRIPFLSMYRNLVHVEHIGCIGLLVH
jgi:hypothetical protein